MSDAVAAGASVVGGIMGFKGNRAAAKNAEAVAEYNARVAENEKILLQRAKVAEEANLRKQSERLASSQRLATAASSVQLAGSPLQALADSYFNTELDAATVQYASSVEQARKQAEANLSRLEGRARGSALRTAAIGSLLEGGQQAATIRS